jgi:hypothetical protein
MNPRALLLALFIPIIFAGCKASLCERKDRWLARNCAGGDVTWSPDDTCEAKVETCNRAQLAQFEGYVKCLESSRECSLDVMGRCGQQYPGGVNLFCAN